MRNTERVAQRNDVFEETVEATVDLDVCGQPADGRLNG
jgi:hypothetical protein